MASVSASYTFADGASIGVCVEGESTYPDCLSTMRATALDMLGDVVGMVTSEAEE